MDVLEASDCAYLFVHQKHPVIALLRANRDLIGNDIDKQQKIDNEWYKVCVCVCPSLSCLPIFAESA
jgi:hypothetical protein